MCMTSHTGLFFSGRAQFIPPPPSSICDVFQKKPRHRRYIGTQSQCAHIDTITMQFVFKEVTVVIFSIES